MLRKVEKMYRRFIMHHIVTSKRLGNLEESNIFVSLKQITFKVGHKLYQSQSAKKTPANVSCHTAHSLWREHYPLLFALQLREIAKQAFRNKFGGSRLSLFKLFFVGWGQGCISFGQCFDFRSCILFRYTTTWEISAIWLAESSGILA